MKILIIEDEKHLLESIAAYFENENFVCELAVDLEAAREKIALYDYDCIVLDISLPDGNGLALLKILKQQNKRDGVVILSAKDSLDDKITGLELGADDYLTKPFHLSELNARIKAVIRRKHYEGFNELEINGLQLDLKFKSLYFMDKLIPLSQKEFDLLSYLIANKNRVISKQSIAEHLMGDSADHLDSFDLVYSHVKNVKKKLREAGCSNTIQSLYGIGYKFESK